MSEQVEQATAAPGERRHVELPEASVVRVKAGDIVLLTLEPRITQEQAHHMGKQLKDVLPEGVKVVAVSGANVTVVTPNA